MGQLSLRSQRALLTRGPFGVRTLLRPGMWGTQRPPRVPGGEGLVNTPTGRTAALAAPEASA